MMLSNSCGLCRQVVVQRMAADGSKSTGTVAIDARSTVPVAMSEAVDLQVVTEKACR